MLPIRLLRPRAIRSWRPFLALSVFATVGLAVPGAADAQDDIIASAASAGPTSVSDHATIMTWDMKTIRKGTNGWTCLPDNPATAGVDPWCANEPWLHFLHALMNKAEPEYEGVGIAYMLAGDSPVSNTDPFATEPTSKDDWVTGLGAHLMMLVPDRAMLEGISTDPFNGGPWIMWPDTPYAHLMVPIESYSGP